MDVGAVVLGEVHCKQDGFSAVALEFDASLGIGSEGVGGYQSASLGLADDDMHAVLQPVESAVKGAFLRTGDEGCRHKGYE